MVILGIDPGLATLGYGVIEVENDKRRMIQYGTLTTPAGEPMPQRLRAIFQGMNQLMDIFAEIDRDKCIDCGYCAYACPVRAIIRI